MLDFYKYHGAGNDFILIDNRNRKWSHDDISLFKAMCDRHLGIGADGLMLLESSSDYDFEMFYVNSDGKPSSMCGNGGRCIVSFAHSLGLIENEARFLAIDGVHHAKITGKDWVSLEMVKPGPIHFKDGYALVNTGSPHLVKIVHNLDTMDVYSQGKEIRYSYDFKEEGVNVNFVEMVSAREAKVRTYERGVENETLSCGTGVTAVALVMGAIDKEIGDLEKTLYTPGGILKVNYHREEGGTIREIILEGPTQFVFQGNYQYQG